MTSSKRQQKNGEVREARLTVGVKINLSLNPVREKNPNGKKDIAYEMTVAIATEHLREQNHRLTSKSHTLQDFRY